jgi:hypothetical protein
MDNSSNQLQDIINRLANIEKRNTVVEESKAWEVSKTRKASILIITYILATIVMYFMDVPNYYLNSLIPTLGYFLSTLSLNFVKKIWLGKIKS